MSKLFSDATGDAALRLPFYFDPARLAADLARVAAPEWQAHFNTRIYQGDWSGVALRAVPGSHLPLYSDASEDARWADTPLLEQCPAFREVLDRFACPLLSVRLLRLGPGAVIKEHCDPMSSLEQGEARIHVVVSTNPQVQCLIQGRPYHWAAGECWFADFSRPHAFFNHGETERVHMVLDCKADDWLRALLEQPGEPAAFPPGTEEKTPRDAMAWLQQRVEDDPDLQARLFDLADGGEFAAALCRLAQEAGYRLEAKDVQMAMRDGRRAWSSGRRL